MLVSIRFTYKKALTAIVLSHLVAFHECGRNPYEEGTEVVIPQREISYHVAKQKSEAMQQTIYQDNYINSSSENPANMSTAGMVANLADEGEATFPAFPQDPVRDGRGDAEDRLQNNPSENLPGRTEVDITNPAVQNIPIIKKSVLGQDTIGELDNSFEESVATQPQVSSLGKDTIGGLDNSFEESVVTQPQVPSVAAHTAVETEPSKPMITITEKMVRSLPDGPLKIAIVQLKKKQELEREGNKGILPINLRQIGAKGMGPIHGAVNAGDLDLVHLVLQSGDNVNRLGPANNTPLHMAVINGDETITRILLTLYKADKQLKNKDGKTPAQIAEERFGNSSSLSILLQ